LVPRSLGQPVKANGRDINREERVSAESISIIRISKLYQKAIITLIMEELIEYYSGSSSLFQIQSMINIMSANKSFTFGKCLLRAHTVL